MKKLIKLTEGDLHRIIESSVAKVISEAESGGWVVDSSEAQEAYAMFAEKMGEEAANEAIVRCLGDEALSQCLAYLFRMYDFREWSDRESA